VERRQRLSRSRDFDAVYRQGRSVSTRWLTLHWFAREEDSDGISRVGLAVPRAVGTAVARNRLKRQLRAVWSELSGDVPPGRDYVLAARTGLADAATSRDHAWLVGEVREVIGKVQA
jgi:ribonuclease P protein component